MASKIEIRQGEDGTLLGSFDTHLEPGAVRQRLTAPGLRAFAEGVGLYLPEVNDPQATPFYDRPDLRMGESTALDGRLPDDPGPRIGGLVGATAQVFRPRRVIVRHGLPSGGRG